MSSTDTSLGNDIRGRERRVSWGVGAVSAGPPPWVSLCGLVSHRHVGAEVSRPFPISQWRTALIVDWGDRNPQILPISSNFLRRS